MKCGLSASDRKVFDSGIHRSDELKNRYKNAPHPEDVKIIKNASNRSVGLLKNFLMKTYKTVQKTNDRKILAL